MNDADVETAIKSVLDAALVTSFSTVVVAQSFNPTTQGAALAPMVLFTKIAARRYGFQGRKYAFNAGPVDFTKTEGWYLEATYQVNTLIRQDAVDPASLNAYDVIDFCAATLQTLETRATLLALGIGIRRVTDIRTPRFLDDSDRYNMDASFDFVLTYQNTLTSTVPGAGVDGEVISTFST